VAEKKADLIVARKQKERKREVLVPIIPSRACPQ
jgi:hypothetical protein